MQQWLTTAGPHRVEHYPLPYWNGAVNLKAPRKGILHTTEGSTIEGALSAFRSQHFTPVFTVGKDAKRRTRILQHKPLGIMGSTLENASGGVETNRDAIAQIELVGFSKKDPWYPEIHDADALTWLMAVLHDVAGIPLAWRSIKRDPAKWVKTSGWMGHIDVPENHHWDPGQIRSSRLMLEAMARLGESAPPVTRSKPRRSDRIRTLPLRVGGSNSARVE